MPGLRIVRCCAYGLDDLAGVWQHLLFEVVCVGSGDVVGVDAEDVVIQIVKAALVHLGCDFGCDGREGPGLIDHDEVIGFAYGLDDGVNGQWANGAAVNDFALDAFLGELLCCFEAEVEGPAEADDGAVAAGASDECFAEGDFVGLFGHVSFYGEQSLGFEEEYGVWIEDCGAQESFGVVGIKGDGELEAGDVGVE